MANVHRVSILSTMLLLTAVLLGGCSDENEGPVTPNETPTPDVSFPGDTSADSNADGGLAIPDTAIAPDSKPAVDAMGDVNPEVDVSQDSGGPQPDTTPPEIVSTTPALGEAGVATPFTVTLTFSEPIYAPTLKGGTNGSVSMKDYLGLNVPLDVALSGDGTVATLTPKPVDDIWAAASPYEVRIAPNILADLAGNKLSMPYVLRFFTAGYPNTGIYKGLAAAYAPRFHIETTGAEDVRRRVPTRVDEDGDWDASNSLQWLASAAAVYPSVYYNVTESYSHYFIHYMAYFPHVATGTSAEHGNGTVGAMVTVKKGGVGESHMPLSVTTYWRTKSNEENDVYATTESGYVGDNSEDWYRVRSVMDQADLFGEDGRYDAFISSTYESCLWNHEETGGLATCKLYEAMKSTMTWLSFEVTSGSPEPLEANEEGGWPSSMDDVEGIDAFGYELVPMAESLWPRRLEDGADQLWGDTYTYSNPSRPADGMIVGSRFVDPVDDISPPYGRPVWAWKFVPAQGETAGIQQGWLGVDPAHYAMKRHGSVDQDNLFVDWSVEDGSGFSTAYCFNPMAFIDARETDPNCAP
jgi:hypothetical protein